MQSLHYIQKQHIHTMPIQDWCTTRWRSITNTSIYTSGIQTSQVPVKLTTYVDDITIYLNTHLQEHSKLYKCTYDIYTHGLEQSIRHSQHKLTHTLNYIKQTSLTSFSYSLYTTSSDAKSTLHSETTYPHNAHSRLVYHKVAFY